MRSATIQINVVADEEPNACGSMVIRLANITLVDAEIDPAIVDEVETLVKDSFAGTVVHMECGYLYASIPREDGSLIIDESRTMMVDEVEVRKHSCVKTIERLITKACSDRVNGKLQNCLGTSNSAEINCKLGDRLMLVARLDDMRVMLAKQELSARNSVIKLALDATCLVFSIAMVYMGTVQSNVLSVICGNIWGLFSIACLPTLAPRAINTVRSLRCTKKSMSRSAAMLKELRRADKKRLTTKSLEPLLFTPVNRLGAFKYL